MSSIHRSRQALTETSLLSVGVLLVLLLFGLVNYFGWKYHERFDWTSAQIYTLSEKSRNVVEGLDRDIEAIVFLSPGEELYGSVTELLARYEASSPRFTVRILDPEKNLAEAQQLVDRYQVSSLNVVVFDAGENQRVVETADLADFDYSGVQFGQAPVMTGFKGEQEFTSALVELMESRTPTVLFTTGHGELSLDDASIRGLSGAEDLLRRDNFEAGEWASLGASAVPGDTDLVVIAGPTTGFVEPEVEVLRTYLAQGGRLLVLLDPTLDAGGALVDIGLDQLLEEYGVQVGDDIVVDPANPLPFFGPETIFANSYGSHPIVEPLRNAAVPVILPLGRSVVAGSAPGWEVEELVRTSAEGWAERSLANLQGVQLGDDDLAGPVALGVAVQAAGDETVIPDFEETAVDTEAAAADAGLGESEVSTRLVVLGDSDFVSNSQLQNAANATLFSNVLNWLVARDALVAIPPKAPDQVRLTLSSDQLRRVQWLVLGGLPLFVIALGVWVYFRRKR